VYASSMKLGKFANVDWAIVAAAAVRCLARLLVRPIVHHIGCQRKHGFRESVETNVRDAVGPVAEVVEKWEQVDDLMARKRVWGLKLGDGHCNPHGNLPGLCQSTAQLSSEGP
jgi:hypothetical protein